MGLSPYRLRAISKWSAHQTNSNSNIKHYQRPNKKLLNSQHLDKQHSARELHTKNFLSQLMCGTFFSISSVLILCALSQTYTFLYFHTLSHTFSYFLIPSHIFSHFHTLSHTFSYFFILSHVFTYFLILSHTFSYFLILFHTFSNSLILSHSFTYFVTVFAHCLST